MQNHYNYFFDSKTETYNFTTKNNIIYNVAFLVDESFSVISGEEIANVFQLIVEKTTDETEPFDAMVSKTIESIVEKFFQKKENALIFICSEANDKAKLRHEIFDRWYKKSVYREFIIKLDNVISIFISQTETQKIYTSFMFHKENSNFQKLIDIYNLIEKVLNEDK